MYDHKKSEDKIKYLKIKKYMIKQWTDFNFEYLT